THLLFFVSSTPRPPHATLVPYTTLFRSNGGRRMKTVLDVRDIGKRYPGFTLEHVSFALAPHRIMGLIGKNGAGKSTTFKAILNMVKPDSGSVNLFQKDFS